MNKERLKTALLQSIVFAVWMVIVDCFLSVLVDKEPPLIALKGSIGQALYGSIGIFVLLYFRLGEAFQKKVPNWLAVIIVVCLVVIGILLVFALCH